MSLQAFRKLAATLKVSENALYNPIYAGIIKSVIKAHIVPGRYGTTMLNKGMTLSTLLSGKTLYTKAGFATSNNGAKAKIIVSAYAGKVSCGIIKCLCMSDLLRAVLCLLAIVSLENMRHLLDLRVCQAATQQPPHSPVVAA